MNTYSQNFRLARVEPPNWWVGFKNDTLQLLLYGENISSATVEISSSAATVLRVSRAQSPNYLFVDMKINAQSPTDFDLILSRNGRQVARYNYKLLKRAAHPQGFGPQDMVYLLMPDRFANGDTANDQIQGYADKLDRNDPDARHGGDIQGIIHHLDYFPYLGATALWLNPVLENNNPSYSYHGYGITDFYKVDPRLGTNELYRNFVSLAHQKGLKVIQDVVYNHCSINHWWMKDLPFTDWVHGANTYQNYHGSVLLDPHASARDKSEFLDSWFVPQMPDLNQNNKFLANYLIQNTLWWIEYAGIDGLRIDTYAYCDKDFMNRLTSRILQEYPDFSILGEIWFQKASLIAPFQRGSELPVDIHTNLQSVTDFGLYYAISEGLNDNDNNWRHGLGRIYYRLAEDYLYPDPQNLAIFIDNHDVERIFTSLGENVPKMKMALTLLMTLRGMPVLYYGTEIGMTSDGKTDGDKRKDFPGGWTGDKINVFTAQGLTKEQKEIFDYVRSLAQWRKANQAAMHGQLIQFIPRNDVYVYFRLLGDQAIMVVLNNSENEHDLDYGRFSEILDRFSYAKNIVTGAQSDLKHIKLPQFSSQIFELYK